MLGIFVMKYLFICKWKRLRPLDDDFFARVIILTALLFGCYLYIMKTLGPGRISNTFIICTGNFTPDEEKLGKHFQIEAPFVYAAFISCIILGVKVEVRKYKIGKKDQKQAFELRNQHILNQESILLNIGIIVLYLTNLYFIITMNK